MTAGLRAVGALSWSGGLTAILHRLDLDYWQRCQAGSALMDAAILVALLALVGTICNVALTYGLNARSERRREEQRADAKWARYRASFAFAADELDHRIGNILNNDFLEAFTDGMGRGLDELPAESRSRLAILSTLFRFCQYLGWSEILRREMRAPDARHADEVAAIEKLQGDVGRTFATDDPPFGRGRFMIWREAQLAIGELMITTDGDVTDTLGVATFMRDFDKFRPWLPQLHEVLSWHPRAWPEGEKARLRAVQVRLRTLAGELRRGEP